MKEKETQENQIDFYRLESEKEMSKAMLQANMAEFEAEKKAKALIEQEEREQLIAEANNLTGRVEAFRFIGKILTCSELITLRKIKENKLYKELRNVRTWEEYCKSLGYSVDKIDLDLQNLNIFGEDFLRTVQGFGLGYRDLRALKKQVQAGALEVKDTEVIIDGETIPLDDKDLLKEALDDLLENKYKKIEELKETIKDKDKEMKNKDEEIKRLQDSNMLFAKDRQKAIDELEHIKGIGSFNGVSLEENYDFSKIKEVENEVNVIALHLDNIMALADSMSELNKKFLGATIIKAMNVLNEFHEELVAKGIQQFYGEAFVPDEVIGAYNKLETPIEFSSRIYEEAEKVEIETEESEEKEIRVITPKASNE